MERTIGECIAICASTITSCALETCPGAKLAADGAAVWKTRVWPTRAFFRQIVAWGGAAEVVGPPDVRAGVREYAHRVATAYRGKEAP